MDISKKYKKNAMPYWMSPVCIYSFAFLIPVILMILYSAMNGIHPFGDKIILTYDANNQYIDYLSYFKTIFCDKNDFFYTFSKNLGGDMAGFSAYYLLSPLNLILLLFPNYMLPDGFLVLVIIKLGLCGLTCGYYLSKKHRPSWDILLFSTSYALCGYTMAYYWNIMWLEGVILLPLVALGIEKILKYEKKGLFYIFSLTAALITNYYIGYMLCLYSAIYCVYTLFVQIDDVKDIKNYIGRIIRYIITSLIAVGLSAFVLVPTFTSLQGGKAKFSLSALKFVTNFNFFDVFAKLFADTATDSQMVGGLPNIFCGIFIVVLLVLYFMNSRIKTKNKIISAGIMLLLLICFYINTFNLVWHGFNVPAWFPYRYSFVFVFTMIFIAYESFINIGVEISNKKFVIGGFALILGMILLASHGYEFLDIKSVWFDIALGVFYLAIIFIIRRDSRLKRTAFIMISLLVTADLSLNAVSNIRHFQLSYLTAEGYADYNKNTQDVIDEVKESDSGFYRVEKTFLRKMNDPMQFNYHGLSHFSSSEKEFVKTFMGKLGFRDNETWAAYQSGSTMSADSLLGVKYLLAKDELNKPYEFLFEKNGIRVYKNPFALSIGFTVKDTIVTKNKDNPDIFDFQNKIWENTVKVPTDSVFTEAEVGDIVTDNLETVNTDNAIKYDKINVQDEASITYHIKARSKDMLYIYMTAPAVQQAEVFVDGQSFGEYFDTNKWYALPVGNFDSGETVEISVVLKGASLEIGDAYFYHESQDALASAYSQLSEESCKMEEISSSHLNGEVEVKNADEYLMFSIPYEKAWRITVDGQRVEPTEVCNALMAVPVSEGKHVIDMKYIPGGFVLGVSVTVVSVFILVIYMAMGKKKKNEEMM